MKKIIMDIDPGHEDFFGLMLAIANREELKLAAVVTTVAYQTPKNVLNNALKVLTLLGCKEIPVAQGASKPLVEPLVLADNWRTTTGLDGADFPTPNFEASSFTGLSLMAQVLSTSVEPVTIAVSGPLTNTALLLQQHPEVHDKIAEIVVMGGGINAWNRRPGVEYNFSIDPEAAEIVVNSGVKVTLITRDLTEQGVISNSTVTKMASLGNPVSDVAAKLMKHYGDFGATVVLNDPEVQAYLIKPELFKGYLANVSIDLEDGPQRGHMTVNDDLAANVTLMTSMDNDGFVELLLRSLRKFG